jgi:hypothetical protein
MESIPKPNSDNNNQNINKITNEDHSKINFSEDISNKEKEKENKDSKTNNNEINFSSNNSKESNFLYKPKDNLLDFKTTYPLLFK